MRDKILFISRISIVVKSKSRNTFRVHVMFFIQSIFLAKENLKFIFDDSVVYSNNNNNNKNKIKLTERNILKGDRG